jgi:hypothetical protein
VMSLLLQLEHPKRQPITYRWRNPLQTVNLQASDSVRVEGPNVRFNPARRTKCLGVSGFTQTLGHMYFHNCPLAWFSIYKQPKWTVLTTKAQLQKHYKVHFTFNNIKLQSD